MYCDQGVAGARVVAQNRKGRCERASKTREGRRGVPQACARPRPRCESPLRRPGSAPARRSCARFANGAGWNRPLRARYLHKPQRQPRRIWMSIRAACPVVRAKTRTALDLQREGRNALELARQDRCRAPSTRRRTGTRAGAQAGTGRRLSDARQAGSSGAPRRGSENSSGVPRDARKRADDSRETLAPPIAP